MSEDAHLVIHSYVGISMRYLAFRKTPNCRPECEGTASCSKLNPLNLADRDLVFGPVIELRGPGRLMRGHLLGMLDPANRSPGKPSHRLRARCGTRLALGSRHFALVFGSLPRHYSD